MAERPDPPNSELRSAVAEQGAFRASTRANLGNGDVLIVRFDPVETNNDWLFMEVPAILGPAAEIDAWEGATLSSSSTISTEHNLNYAGQETSNASVTETTDGTALDTSAAEQTEETTIPVGGTGYQDSQTAQERTWWRVIPPNEDITVRVTNTSGNAEPYSFNLVFYERSDWANQDLL